MREGAEFIKGMSIFRGRRDSQVEREGLCGGVDLGANYMSLPV